MSSLVVVLSLSFFLSLFQHAATSPPCEFAKLTASDGAEGDNFGISVANHGTTIVVGAKQDVSHGPGAVYVYRIGPGGPSEEQILHASDGDVLDEFGRDVAVDGGLIVVGAPANDDEGENAGAVYVFRYFVPSWVQEAKLVASDAAPGDQFGYSVAASGTTIVVGAFLDDASAGSAYVLRYSNGSWIEEAKLIAPDAAVNDRFGESVSIDGEGIIVGAPQDDDNGTDSGAVYVFRRSVDSWMLEAKLTAPDALARDLFGIAVDIDIDRIIVGARNKHNSGVSNLDGIGGVYFYEKINATWSNGGIFDAPNDLSADWFGESVAVFADIAIAGASQANNSGNGYVRRFSHDGTKWVDAGIVTASDGASGDFFGHAVDVRNGIAAVGAWGDGDLGFRSGSTYAVGLSNLDCNEDGVADSCQMIPNVDGADDDGDEVCLSQDNCPNDFNPLQGDSDVDGTGDACDVVAVPAASTGSLLALIGILVMCVVHATWRRVASGLGTDSLA